MSVKIMAAVWELNLQQNEKLILLAFADHADDEGQCWPSIKRIAWKSGYSVRQTQEIVAILKRCGILEPIKYEKGGRGHATVYKIHSEKGAKLASFSFFNGCGQPNKRVNLSAQKGAVVIASQPSRTTDEPLTGSANAPTLAASPVWKETGVDPLSLSLPFRKLCEDRWSIRDGATLPDFMGDVLDAWRVLEGPNCKYPRAWVQRKAEIARSMAKKEPNLPELEAIPWNK